jgi:hypothetical protein
MLKKIFCDDTMSVTQTLNGIHIWQVLIHHFRILNVQVAHCQVGLMTMWRKCSKSFMRTDGVRLTIFVTFKACHKIYADTF